MLFFVVLIVFALAAYAVPALAGGPARMRLAMALALVLAGADHWLTPGRYLVMMPPAIPYPLEVVLFTGAAEIAGGLGLLVPRVRTAAGILLAAYFVAVFPANIHNALSAGAIPGLPAADWYYWLRLPLQPVAVWWALYSAECIRWPFAARAVEAS